MERVARKRPLVTVTDGMLPPESLGTVPENVPSTTSPTFGAACVTSALQDPLVGDVMNVAWSVPRLYSVRAQVVAAPTVLGTSTAKSQSVDIAMTWIRGRPV